MHSSSSIWWGGAVAGDAILWFPSPSRMDLIKENTKIQLRKKTSIRIHYWYRCTWSPFLNFDYGIHPPWGRWTSWPSKQKLTWCCRTKLVWPAPTISGQRQVKESSRELSLLMPGRYHSFWLFPFFFSHTLAFLMTGRAVLQAHQWNSLLLPWRQRRMGWDRGTWDVLSSRNLCFSIDLPQQRFKWFFPDIYCISTCHHDFAQAEPFFQSVPPSYLQLTRSYSNAASFWRSFYLCLHSSPVVFNSLFWASYITALTTSCWYSGDTWCISFPLLHFYPCSCITISTKDHRYNSNVYL